MRKLLYVFGLFFLLGCANAPQEEANSFEFAFITDIHLKPEMNAPEGFQMAIDKVNELGPDFVLTGGDLVFDVMRGNQARGDSLFTLYSEMVKGFDMPVHHCVGNHDLFAIYEESPETSDHPDYKYGMFERYLGKTYHSFDHMGWHFIVLNSLDVTENKRYKGHIHQEQMEWLKEDIAKTDTAVPIVIATHLPLVTTRGQVTGSSSPGYIDNGHEIFTLLENHNLKLILQGHIHWKESGYVNDRFHFITGGSIAGNGWKGRRHDTREGFMHIRVKGDDFTWEYIDHGWEAKRLSEN